MIDIDQHNFTIKVAYKRYYIYLDNRIINLVSNILSSDKTTSSIKQFSSYSGNPSREPMLLFTFFSQKTLLLICAYYQSFFFFFALIIVLTEVHIETKKKQTRAKQIKVILSYCILFLVVSFFSFLSTYNEVL